MRIKFFFYKVFYIQNGSIAGNLSIKHQHIEFPSDIFLILETAGATLTILEGDEKTWKTASPASYLSMDMTKKVILNVLLPSLDSSRYSYRSYKVQGMFVHKFAEFD